MIWRIVLSAQCLIAVFDIPSGPKVFLWDKCLKIFLISPGVIGWSIFIGDSLRIFRVGLID